MFREISPNSVMKALSIKVEAKRIPDESLSANELDLMPISRERLWKRVGCGDWERGRSEGGSVVFGDGEKVLKMHVGKTTVGKDVMEWAKQKREGVEIFQEMAPPTTVIVVDGVDGPRPAVIQDQVHGKPIYRANFSDILAPGVFSGLAKIMKLMEKGLREGYCPDISGLRFKTGNRNFGRLLRLCPFFSDNIMIDNNKGVWLVDNVPELRKDDNQTFLFNLKTKASCAILHSWELIFLGLSFSQKIFQEVRKKNNSPVLDIHTP